MSTEHIIAVAQAGFTAYYADRPWYTWRLASFPVTCRWEIIAAAFVNGNHDGPSVLATARKLRDAYTDGIYCTPHSHRTDRDWQRVYTAMARARDADRGARDGDDDGPCNAGENTMSNLIEHARYELTRAGLFDDDADYGGAHAQAVMDLMEVFASQGHSGMSAAITLRLFYDLAEFKPIGPITSDPDEWTEVTDGMWQNKRRSTSFSHDGGATWYDIEDEALNNGAVWPNKPA